MKRVTRGREKDRSRFWFSITPTFPVTKKAQNARMGKGRGKFKFWFAQMRSSTPICYVGGLRVGRVSFLRNFIFARLGVPTFYRTLMQPPHFRPKMFFEIFLFPLTMLLLGLILMHRTSRPQSTFFTPHLLPLLPLILPPLMLTTPHLMFLDFTAPATGGIATGIDFFYYPFLMALIIVTVLTIFFLFAYNTAEFTLFTFFIVAIFVNALIFFHTRTFLLFFLSYEMFLLPSFFILYVFSKTRRAVEASIYMFFWTQFGALLLFLSFLYLRLVLHVSTFALLSLQTISGADCLILGICWFVGFGVKIPLWPFYGWLPKAHVEASTNFSIFLSGVLVKFAFFGLFRCLTTLTFHGYLLLLPLLFIGICDGTWKLFIQVDLKKMVAYMTVVEMHWLCFATIGGYTPLLFSALCMLFNHALLSTQAFLLVDAVARRYKTRLLFEVQGIFLTTPYLGFLILSNLLLFLGFPGTLSFVSEFLFFTFLLECSPEMWLGGLCFLYFLMPTFFFKNWFPSLFNMPHYEAGPRMDLTWTEALLFNFLTAASVWYGLNWQILLLI